MVTYSNLLENSEVFGKGVGLGDAEGELSMVLEGPEEGFSINALYRKYRAQLVGKKNADLLGKDFPLRFEFAKADDLYSIKIALRTDDAKSLAIDDFFELLVAKELDSTIASEGCVTRLKRGQVAFVTNSVSELVIEPTDAILLRIK